MRHKWPLIASLIQLIIGLVSVLTILFLDLFDENITRWIITLFLALLFVILGIVGIIDNKKSK